MGNCICVIDKTTTTERIRRRRSTVFHDDDDDDGEKLLGETSNVTSSSSSCGRREVKIKMTKKEFEDLMRNISLKGLTAEDIFSKLLFDGGDQMGFTADLSNHHQRTWRPALQSIPEIE